jgi:exonuclease I
MPMNSEIQAATHTLAELVAKQQPRGYDSFDLHRYQRAILEALEKAGAPSSQA